MAEKLKPAGDVKPGDLLMLTAAYDAFVRARNPRLALVLTNRLAKLEEIIDWESPKGRLIKETRIKSGKWAKLPLEENRYIVSVFYPDVTGRNGKIGVAERGVPLFRFHPETREPFFIRMPDWVARELTKGCETFSVEPRDVP